MSSKPKHIVIDARNRRASGVGRYTDRLLEHLQALDSQHRYTVLLLPDDDWHPVQANFSLRHSSYKQFSFNPLEQLGFAWLLYRLRADLVHFTMTQHPLLYFRPFVVTTHDLTMLRFVRPGKTSLPIFWLKKVGYRLLFWAAHRKARAIVVPSEYVKQDLITLHPFAREKVLITYEAAEPPISAPAIPVEGVAKQFIFHAGSPFPHKNIERLIEAFERLQAYHPELQLVLVGKKEYYFERLEASVASSPAFSHIIFTGFVSEGQLKWLYEHARAYVLPSLSEGFGLPGLEAMTHGCPLVSSNATCLPEMYGQAAHYFDPEDIEEMADRIGEVIDRPPLRQRLVAAGYKQIRKYSWRRTAEQTEAAYQSALDQPGGVNRSD